MKVETAAYTKPKNNAKRIRISTKGMTNVATMVRAQLNLWTTLTAMQRRTSTSNKRDRTYKNGEYSYWNRKGREGKGQLGETACPAYKFGKKGDKTNIDDEK